MSLFELKWLVGTVESIKLQIFDSKINGSTLQCRVSFMKTVSLLSFQTDHNERGGVTEKSASQTSPSLVRKLTGRRPLPDSAVCLFTSPLHYTNPAVHLNCYGKCSRPVQLTLLFGPMEPLLPASQSWLLLVLIQFIGKMSCNLSEAGGDVLRGNIW